MEDSNGDEHVVLCQLPSSGDTYYDQSVVPNTNASCVWSDRTPNPNNLALLVYNFVHNFDPSYDFDKTKFSIGSQQWMQGNYLCHVDFRGNQDTYAWIGAVDTSTNPATVTGQMLQCRGGALSGAESSRWCAVHTSHPVLGAPPKMSWTAKTPNGSNVTLWQTTITGAITSSQLTVTFATNTPLDVTTGDTPPYSIQSGDEVYFDPQTGNQEIAILGSNVSGTTWNIAARGVAGTTAKAHADGSAMQMGCRSHRPSDATAVGPNWWDFVNDPHGVDRTGTYYIAQLANVATYAGHEGFANGTGIAEGGWYEFIGPAMVNNTVFFNSDSPTFAGAAKNGSGDSWQKHAGAAQQSNATGAQGGYNWGSEFFVLDQDIELKPTSLTNITGTLWKWVNTNYTLSRKNLAMMALSGTHPLLDVSSTATGNVIGGLAADNYKYCVANAVNECRTGSAIGDIYINSPGIIGGSTCPGGSGSWTDETILCFGHPPAFGGAVLQLGVIAADGTGRYNRSLTQGLIPFKSNNQSADAHTTPDGRWTVYPYRIGWGDTALSGMWLARVPPWSGYDGINRNTFIQKTVTLGGPAASVTAITEFGYDTNLYCTSRNEVCVSAQANNPYFFASESYTRISCPSGVCTNTIPVIPDRTAYYRHKFYDSGGNLINTSDLFLLAEDSAPVVGGGPAAVISGQVVVSGPVTII
jgi:hypothetical protein